MPGRSPNCTPAFGDTRDAQKVLLGAAGTIVRCVHVARLHRYLPTIRGLLAIGSRIRLDRPTGLLGCGAIVAGGRASLTASKGIGVCASAICTGYVLACNIITRDQIRKVAEIIEATFRDRVTRIICKVHRAVITVGWTRANEGLGQGGLGPQVARLRENQQLPTVTPQRLREARLGSWACFSWLKPFCEMEERKRHDCTNETCRNLVSGVIGLSASFLKGPPSRNLKLARSAKLDRRNRMFRERSRPPG